MNEPTIPTLVASATIRRGDLLVPHGRSRPRHGLPCLYVRRDTDSTDAIIGIALADYQPGDEVAVIVSNLPRRDPKETGR